MKKNKDEFIMRLPKKYSNDLSEISYYTRYKKATSSSKATQKEINKIIDLVRKKRNEKELAKNSYKN